MTIIVTGAAGFIGFHVCQALLARGRSVLGLDSLNDYYDPRLKAARLAILEAEREFTFRRVDIAEHADIKPLFAERPETEGVIHLAAQPGVRHSLKDPFVYVSSNVMGQVTILEACRTLPNLKHLVYASSSSVYGANDDGICAESDRVDRPVSMYAATKRSAELIAETYAHLYAIPVTGLRFFTVYGPWGRPDMAPYIFTKAILEGRPIQVFNHGSMRRAFTYIDDVVAGTIAALDRPPPSGSGTPPHKIYNLGSRESEELVRFIELIERACGKTARKDLLPLQPGDVRATCADITSAQLDLGYAPSTPLEEGIPRFVEWYIGYHGTPGRAE